MRIKIMVTKANSRSNSTLAPAANSISPVFDPNSPQSRLKSISKNLLDKINIYKTDKSPFNRADLNDLTALAASLKKEAVLKGADKNTIALITTLINQATVLLNSNGIAFGKPTLMPQIPQIPQVKLNAPLIPKTGNAILDALAQGPNAISIAGTALVGGGINGLAAIPNSGAGVINGAIQLPAKIYDHFTRVQKRTGATSSQSWLNSPGRHYVYNAMGQINHQRKVNAQNKAAMAQEVKAKGAVPAYSEAAFGWLGSTGVQLFAGAKLAGKAPKPKALPQGKVTSVPKIANAPAKKVRV
jgi:hypothetical protein